jgi:hypothetical protein
MLHTTQLNLQEGLRRTEVTCTIFNIEAGTEAGRLHAFRQVHWQEGCIHSGRFRDRKAECIQADYKVGWLHTPGQVLMQTGCMQSDKL